MKYSPTEVSNNLKEYNFNFKKKFGQNFIIDENVIDNIINILRRNKVNLIIATHSPFIINKYWDYTQKLGSIEE